jgi:hypothetical protein
MKATSMDKRVERNNQSVLNLRNLLQDITIAPDKYLEQNLIIQSLKSQGLLAKFSDEPKGIFPSSINTQKRIAANVVDGGYEALDQLRVNALLAVEKKANTNNQPDKETKAGLLLTIKELESEKQSIRNDLLLLTLAFEKSLRQGARYASLADPSIQALCKKEQRELLDILSLRKNNLNTNVVKLHED